MGIDLKAEPALLWIVDQALVAPLPSGWTEHIDDDTGIEYYYHAETGESTYDHPNDAIFAQLVKTERARAATSGATLSSHALTIAKYLCVKKAALKKGAALDSEACGGLEVGETIDVVEERITEHGQLRLRCSRGWTSEVSRQGVRLMRKLAYEPPIEIPEPQPVAALGRAKERRSERRVVFELEPAPGAAPATTRAAVEPAPAPAEAPGPEPAPAPEPEPEPEPEPKPESEERKELVAIYEKYNPRKIADVDALLGEWAGDEAELLRNVRAKYLSEFAALVSVNLESEPLLAKVVAGETVHSSRTSSPPQHAYNISFQDLP